MDFKTIHLRFAHTDGHTCLAYTSDGSQFLTCGSDGDLRVFKNLDDVDPVSECVGEMAVALAFHDNHFYVGSDNNYVQSYTFPDARRDGIISRFTAPVTHIAVGPDGHYIAAGSSDMEVQVTDMWQGNSIVKLSGHTAPVTGVAVDPASVYVASSSCDGSVRVWNIAQAQVAKVFLNVIATCNDFFRAIVLGRPSWQGPAGALLAVPTSNNVTLYERDTWLPKKTLTNAKVIGRYTLAEFSPCGRYLAGGSTSGELIIWNVADETTVGMFQHVKRVAYTCLAWRPTGLSLAVCDRLGQFTIIEDWLPPPVIVEPPQAALDDHEEDDNEISIDRIKRNAGWGSPRNDDDASSVTSFRSASPAPRRPSLEIDLQPAFQPSSTPTRFSHRFMVWNSIGIIRCFNTDEEKSIDVEFHDTMFHHTLHINNYEEYNMAALSTRAVVLASSTPSISSDNPSKLSCIMLNAWDGTKEWSVALEEGEAAAAVAAADRWVAAATSTGHVRLWTYAGTQRQPLAPPGHVVCLAAHADKMAVVYHQGLGAPGCQNLGVVVYQIEDLYVRTVAPPQPLPLSHRARLMWAGFSDEGRLCSFDSDGVLRCLGSDNRHWTLLADTRRLKGPSDHYFMIGVSDRYQNMRCVLCKGARFPATTPRPTVVEVAIRLPLCEPESERTGLEEAFWRLLGCLPAMEEAAADGGGDGFGYQTDLTDMDKTLKQTVIKLFANACKGDLDLRATEIARLMSAGPLQLAATYASKCGKMHLAEKLSRMVPREWSDLRHLAGPHGDQSASAVYCHDNGTDAAAADAADYNAASQRDIFEDSLPRAAPKLLTESKQASTDESQLLNMTVTPPAPVARNPFKVKASQKAAAAAAAPRGLNFFNKPAEPPKVIKNDPIRNPALLKKLGKQPKRNVLSPLSEGSQTKKETFVDWFASNKDSLSQENPGLDMAELTRKAVGIFRQQSALVATPESQDSELTRKAVGIFRQQSALVATPESQDSELTRKAVGIFRQQSALVATPESQDSPIPATAIESQKRKLDDSDDVSVENVKKIASSKLSAFAFKSSR